jgi:hypothetical protein
MRRAGIVCLLPAQLAALLSWLADDLREGGHAQAMDAALQADLEPLHVKNASRCASRGIWHTFGDSSPLAFCERAIVHTIPFVLQGVENALAQ